WVAVDRDQRPIFHYAGIPCRLRLPAGDFDILVGVDFWTLPEYRRQGIFTRCASWIHQHWRHAGYAGLLGAPNEQFGSRDRFLGWRPLFPLRWQIRPLRPEAILARRLRLASLGRLRGLGDLWNRYWDRGAQLPSGLDVESLGDETLGVETLGAESLGDETLGDETLGADDDAGGWLGAPASVPLPAAPWGLERGADWLRWRYLDCPQHDYRLLRLAQDQRSVGYLAYRIEELAGRHFGFIAETVAEGDAPDGIEALITAGTERLAAAGVDAIATLSIPGTDLYRRWRRRGYRFSWGSFGIQCLPFRQVMDPDGLRDPSRWSLMGGDFDVI
ncbi:MAG: hypothetical protein AAF560_10360, partial [Acidobacteriota bacterium]